MATPEHQSAYDVFVSYSHEDEQWVQSELLPRLKNAGLKVCIDSESYQRGEPFEAGTPLIRAIEKAILVSHKTICVFSPTYSGSEWCELEDILISSLDPSGREKRLLPILLKACELPQRIKARLYVDFTPAGTHDQAWGRLLAAIEGLTTALPMVEEKPPALPVAEERAGKVEWLPGMQAPQYLDFELRIEKKGQGYQAAVVHSPCGEASHIFKRPFSDLELENLVLRLGGTRRGLRRIASAEMETVRQFGSKLFDVVFCDDVRSCFFSSQREAKGKSLGLRLKLRLEAPELINIPWEYLYDASRGRFLAQFEGTPIVRYMDLPEPIEPLHMKPPLSILIMASSPTDYPTLEVGSEGEKLKEALQGLADQGMVKTTWVEKANLPALADCLLHGEYHIFHYIGHGGFDERSQDGVLVLEDEQRLGQLVSAERLAVLLGNQPTLRLVILNACEGARTSRDDPFAGMATTLVRTGNVPAVVAMQFAITDEAAVTFARGFYGALAVGRPVDAAVTQARLAIFAAGNDVEWGTPVLYMRSPDGRIFDVEALSPEERTERRRLAEAARAEAGAQAQLGRQQAEERGRREEQARQAELARLYAMADEAAQAKDWSKAIEPFEAVLQSDPGYRDAADRLTQTRKALAAEQAARQQEADLSRLYAQALAHLQAQRWPEAIAGFQAVVAIDPHYGDPTHGSAATLLARAQQQKELAKLPPAPAAAPPRPATPPEDIRSPGKPRDLPR